MIAAEFNTPLSTVRIHDEYCEAPDRCLARLSLIVSGSYKRRALPSGLSHPLPQNSGTGGHAVQ